MSKAEELAVNFLKLHDIPLTYQLIPLFEQYGRLVQEAAAEIAYKEVPIDWPGDAESCMAGHIGHLIKQAPLP